MDNILNIVLICDKNFVVPTGICIQSIIQSKNNDTKITIHVIAQDVTDSQQAFLYRFNKEENIETGLKKFGAMIGDHVEVGCNSVLNPGTVIGQHSQVYPLSMVRGVVPENSIYKAKDNIVVKEKR